MGLVRRALIRSGELLPKPSPQMKMARRLNVKDGKLWGGAVENRHIRTKPQLSFFGLEANWDSATAFLNMQLSLLRLLRSLRAVGSRAESVLVGLLFRDVSLAHEQLTT